MTAATPPLAFDWQADALQAALQPLAPGLVVEVCAETGSTNSDLTARARGAGAAPAPVLRVAERQTAGRGRLGRPWWSQPGQGLTFSLGLALAPADWSGLSLAVGLALAEALEPLPPDAARAGRIGVKWPNDLWLRDGDRKLAGILIEVLALPGRADAARWTVIGVGLNLQPVDADAAAFGSGYACLAELAPADPPTVLQRLAPALLRALRDFERDGLAPRRAAYARRDVLAGRRVRAGELEGEAVGLAPDGALHLRDAAGRLHAVASGEVSVRPC